MPQNPTLQRDLSRLTSRELIEAAAAMTGFRMTRPEFGSARNISGIRTKTLSFSRRHDSLTVFASDARYGYLGRAGAWTGDDKTAVAALRRVLRAAKVPAREVAGVDVLSDASQVAERASEDEWHVHEPSLLRKVARARRAVDGIPAWSSYATLGLTATGELGSLELHWPALPPPVVKEAGVLQSLVKRGFKPPELAGARPEAVEAGVIHSRAVGFFMDVMPAVRVIYAIDEPDVGRKPTLYLDRHGEPVAMPRDIELAQPEAVERPEPR
jgi:hypothetical protein